MAEPDPFDPLLDQISELLIIASENQGEAIKGKIDQDLLNQLDFLEMKVQFFKNVTDQALKMSGISEEELEKNIDQSITNPNSKMSRMIARAGQLKSQLEVLEKQYEMRAKLAKTQKKQKKATGKKRKNKFKKLGGQGWIPL
jgi:vacuolar-type H+-ATPase subunit I/STV1